MEPLSKDVIRWVNIFLYNLCKHEKTTVVLRESMHMPAVGTETLQTPQDFVLAEYAHAINVLKMMSGVDVGAGGCAGGSFQLSHKEREYQITTFFDDEASDPFCRIEIEPADGIVSSS